MSILSWIEDQRKLKLLNAPKYNHPDSDGSQGLWTRCDHCGVILYIKHLKENQRVCFGCGYHLQMNSSERIEHLIDAGTWRPLDETVSPCDPLEFRDQKLYVERLKEAQERTGLQDGVQTGTGMLDGIPVALGVMDFNFMGGSMGSVVGEKITRLIEYATQEGLPLMLVCASGGARMQEGILSLMQMAKISGALHVHQNCAKLLYIAVLTSPTTGGVTASFAMLGDLIFAEPKALIGFAGRRVIEQTLQEQLPDDFQTAEYLLHHGLLDLIVPRSFLKQALSETITLYKEAPLKLRGSIPYGQRGSLTKVREEQLRRFSKSAYEPKYQEFLAEFQGLLQVLDAAGPVEVAKQTEFVDTAIALAAETGTQTNWLNPSPQQFQVRSTFGTSET
jgi:acetyl-CoA carboxylase carboxyl transferase subunit beta